MTKLTKKLVLIITTLTIGLASCNTNVSTDGSSSGDENSGVKYNDINFNDSVPDISIKKASFDPLEIGSDNDPATDVDVTTTGKSQLCTYDNVATNFSVTAISKGMFLSPTTLQEENLVNIEDQTGERVDAVITNGNDSHTFLITSEDGYTPGECYTISLSDNAPLYFEGKDESIRKISFSVAKDDISDSNLKENNFKHYSSSIIESINDVDTDDMYLITTSSISASKDDIVVFDYADGEDLYIKFISISDYEGSKYKVIYTDPEAGDIFNSLELHRGNEQIDMEKYFTVNDEEEIRKSILNSDFVQEYAAAVAYTYNFSNGWVDFWQKAKIDIVFNLDKTKINFQIIVTFTTELNDDWLITASLMFQYKRELTVTADAKLKWKVIVPYVSMNSTVVADDTYSVQFQILFVKKTWNDKYKEMKDPKKLKWDDAKDAVKDLKERAKNSEETKTSAMNAKVTGSSISIPLGSLVVPLQVVPLTLGIDLSFNIKIEASLGLVAGYTYNQRQVFLQYSNSSKNETKGSSSPEIKKASTVNVDFYGKLYTEVYLELAISLYLNGLRKIFRLELSVDAGIYLSISGYGGATYDFIQNVGNIVYGGEVVYGLFIRITLSLVLINTRSLNYKLYEKKLPLLDLGMSTNILSLANNPDVYITKKKTNLNDTSALTFNIFDGNTMTNTIKTFKYNESQKVISGLLIPHDVSYNIFTGMKIEGSNYITLSDGVLTIKDGAPKSFDANLIVTVKADYSVGTDWNVTIPLHITQTESYFVTFDGDTSSSQSYTVGDDVKLKLPEEKDGYYFYGYSADGGDTFIDESKGYKMPNYDVNISLVYEQNVYYTVKYYDGFNNYLGEEKVLNKQAANGIEASVRDKNMTGYTFLGWDVDLSCVTKDITAKGVYVKVGAN